MISRKKVLDRPKKRVLVRWDSDLDELLLLTIQSVCNAKNVKIPWADVASTMRHNVTEGAIIQHLAKLRNRRVDAGKFVPPPLRRGGIGAPNKASNASTTYSGGGARRKMRNAPESDSAAEPSNLAQDTDNSSDEEYVDGRRSKTQKDSARSKGSRVQRKEDRRVLPQSGSDQDADGSPISSEDLVVSGAQFLEYPNHRAQDRSPPRLRKQSKVVVLRYRRGAQLTSDKPIKVESQEHTPVNAFEPHNQSLLDQKLYQDLHGTKSSNAIGAADAHSTGGNYLSADHSNMGMSSIPNSNSNFLEFGSSQGLHMNAYQNFYPSSRQNEQLGFVPNTWNHLNPHQSEQMDIAPGEPGMYFDDVFQYIHANDAHQDDNGATFAGSGDMDPFF